MRNAVNSKMMWAIMAALSVATSFAGIGFEQAEVHIGYRGRKEEVRTVACVKQPDGAWRLHMPTRDIPRDAWYVDVFTDGATMPKGDGYWVTGDGNYGRLTRDTGFHETYATRLPLFGGVSAKGAFTAIVKTLRGEFVQQVKAAKGICRIYPRFKIEKIEFDVYDDIVVDYYPLAEDHRREGAAALRRGEQRKRVRPLRLGAR